jgi:hypothetical protein
MTRELDYQMSMKWNEDKNQEFERTVRKLQAEGVIDTSTTKSEIIRRILESWSENPDKEMVAVEQ